LALEQSFQVEAFKQPQLVSIKQLLQLVLKAVVLWEPMVYRQLFLQVINLLLLLLKHL